MNKLIFFFVLVSVGLFGQNLQVKVSPEELRFGRQNWAEIRLVQLYEDTTSWAEDMYKSYEYMVDSTGTKVNVIHLNHRIDTVVLKCLIWNAGLVAEDVLMISRYERNITELSLVDTLKGELIPISVNSLSWASPRIPFYSSSDESIVKVVFVLRRNPKIRVKEGYIVHILDIK